MRKWLTFLLLGFTSLSLSAQFKNYRFTSNKKVPIQLDHLESWFSFIPMQSFPTDGKIVSVQAFYMLRFETPNMLYRLFVEDLKASGKITEYESALPDTNIWFSGLKPYQEYYFRHPAYDQYPVMGVSKAKVQMFCDWLNEKVKKLKLKDWKNKKVIFRLPTEVEWMVAASGGDTNSVYAWNGPYLRKLDPYLRRNERIFAGDYQANFLRVEDSQVIRGESGELTIAKNSIHQVAGDLKDEAYITAPVNNYWPNGYGLFNMCGNVREMVIEDGFTKGGGWIDPGAELKIRFRNTYQKEGFPCEGFRIIAVVE